MAPPKGKNFSRRAELKVSQDIRRAVQIIGILLIPQQKLRTDATAADWLTAGREKDHPAAALNFYGLQFGTQQKKVDTISGFFLGSKLTTQTIKRFLGFFPKRIITSPLEKEPGEENAKLRLSISVLPLVSRVSRIFQTYLKTGHFFDSSNIGLASIKCWLVTHWASQESSL